MPTSNFQPILITPLDIDMICLSKSGLGGGEQRISI